MRFSSKRRTLGWRFMDVCSAWRSVSPGAGEAEEFAAVPAAEPEGLHAAAA